MAKNVVTVKRESYAISKKGDKGITLLALIIMIIIILMLAGVVINSGMGAYKEAKLTQFVARMNMVQSRVNVAYADIKAENKKVEDYGISADSVNGSIKNKISNIIPGGNISDYRYLSKIDLEEEEHITKKQDREIDDYIEEKVADTEKQIQDAIKENKKYKEKVDVPSDKAKDILKSINAYK